MAINLDDPLPLSTAGFYSAPQDAAAFLPVVFGDYLSSTHVPTDDGDGGFLPAVSIDTNNWVYLLNNLPNVSGSIRIYANDRRQDPIVYTYVPLGDYQAKGHAIAYVQFHTNPGSRTISWRGQGARAYPADTLITNPLDALSTVFGGFGGWSANDTDWASLMETRRLMNVLGDTINMVFHESRSYREWLETVLQLYHTDMGLDANGRMRFMLDTSVTTQPTTVLYTLDARRDLVGAEAEPITIVRDADDIVTKLTVKARRKWTNGAYTAEPWASFAPGVSRHGERHRRYEMPGMYTFAQYERWLRGMWIRYGMRADRVLFTVRGLSLMAALPGTFLGMVSPKRHWEMPWLLKVLNCEPNDEEQTVTFECFDCQRPVDVAATLPVVVMPQVRTRPIESSLTVDLLPPGPASGLVAFGNYRSIVLRWTPPSDLDYDHTEIWAAGVNNRASASFIRNGGYQGTACEETFEVAEGATYYVWLMTVDRDGNGAKGGTGSTGGNWFPLSPTAGVVATAALVPTVGIQLAAVTTIYDTDSTYIGATAGEQAVAATFFNPPIATGSMIAWGNISLSVPNLCTATILIRQGSIVGPVLGQAIYSNIFNVAINAGLVVPGAHFNPVFGVNYLLTARVLNQAFADVGYTVNGVSLLLQHTKR